jgi:hypothetical protein
LYSLCVLCAFVVKRIVLHLYEGNFIGTPHHNHDGLFQPSLSNPTRQQRDRR